MATRSIALATFNTCEFLIRVISKEMDVFIYIYIYAKLGRVNLYIYTYELGISILSISLFEPTASSE